jgi:endo-1,4-beta-xylanase
VPRQPHERPLARPRQGAALAVGMTALALGCGQSTATGAPDRAAPRTAVASSAPSVPEALARARRRSAPALGAAVSWERIQRGGTYPELLVRHFRAITPETEMKMDALAPAFGRFDFTRADALVDWARARGIRVNAHTLLWHQQQPPWLAARTWTRDELLAVLRWYVHGVVRHFRGRVASWDVVNEPLSDVDGSLRPSIWQRVIGDDYIAHALRSAREADPDVRLIVNDYNIERPGAKADGMVRLLGQLLRERVPLDAVGLQSHFSTGWVPTADQLEATMRRYAALGLGVDITELDVEIGPGGAELLRQAAIYRRVGAACRRVAACSRLTTWGFTDASTWLGSEARPLLFTASGAAKPAWPALVLGLGDVP